MEQRVARRHRRKRKPPVWPYIALVVLAVIGVIFVISVGVQDFEMTLNGEQNITLEFGEEYQEAGVSVMLNGAAADTTVKTKGEVNSGKLGTYTVKYTARHYWRTVKAERTVQIVDTQAPTIVLIYDSNSYTPLGQEYQEEGFIAEDNYDGDITDRVQRTVENDTVIYRVTDSSGNTAEARRPIKYGDQTAPNLKLLGDASVTITAGTKFEDPGFTAVDNVDGDVSAKVTVTGDYNMYVPGTYTLTYSVADSSGNIAEVTRTVVVEGATQPEVVVPEGKVIYLTFDDGPSKYTLQLLEVLEKYNVKATFFIVGNAGVGHLDEIAAGGHSIGIHSMTHVYSEIYASEEAYFKDLYATQQLIYERTGILTTLMRFPGGSSNKVSIKINKGIMTRLTAAVEAQGFQYFDWNVSSGDAGETTKTEEVFQNVINGVKHRDISVVLQHDIKGYSVAAVEQIIQWGLANGYTFLPLEPSSPVCHSKINN